MLDYLFTVCDLGTITMSVVIGTVVGWLFFSERRTSKPYLIALLFIGEAFLMAIATTRALEGVRQWSSWLGCGILWATFCLAAAVPSFYGRFRQSRFAAPGDRFGDRLNQEDPDR